MKRFLKGQKGFTLIELLVVVAILGVLAAVAIPQVTKFIGRGETEAMNTELANVQVAVTAAMAESTATGHTCLTYAGGTVGINASTTAAVNDPALYLLNDTEWTYVILANGTTTPTGVKALTWATGS